MNAAGIGGKRSANLGGAFGCQRNWIEVTCFAGRFGRFSENDAGFHRHCSIDRINAEDPVHAGETENDRAAVGRAFWFRCCAAHS